MKYYITINSTVDYFEIHIFKKNRKGRVAINYTASKIESFNTRKVKFNYDPSDSGLVVNICKWFATYEANKFLGNISYIEPGISSAFIIKDRSGVEHFLKEWL